MQDFRFIVERVAGLDAVKQPLCALKACIAKQVNQYDFPNKQLANQSNIHNLTELLGVAGLREKLSEEVKADTEFGFNWAVAKDWSETSRYECNIDKKKAIDLFNAVTEINSGVLAWLKTYW